MDREYERGILNISIKSSCFIELVDNELVGDNNKDHYIDHNFITSNLHRFDKCVSKQHILNDNHVYFMDVNRYSKNFVVVEFFPGTGGHFLVSCLNLSNNVSKHMSKELKKECIKKTLDTSKGWVDPINYSFDWDNCETEKSINNDEFIFFLTHHYDGGRSNNSFRCTSTKQVLDFFYNAKVLRFENWIPFYCLRRYARHVPLEEYLELSLQDRKKLFSNIDFGKDKVLNSKTLDRHKNLPPSDYAWDTMNFFSKELFLTGLKKLYDDIGLVDFDTELISWYYDIWIDNMAIWGKYK